MITTDNRVLMQRRPPLKAHGGLWEFPGGKVEPGEALTKALARELREELAVSVDERQLEPFTFTAADKDPHVILLYTCRQWGGHPVCVEDGAMIDWLTADELCKRPMPPLDVSLAGSVRALLAKVI